MMRKKEADRYIMCPLLCGVSGGLDWSISNPPTLTEDLVSRMYECLHVCL